MISTTLPIFCAASAKPPIVFCDSAELSAALLATSVDCVTWREISEIELFSSSDADATVEARSLAISTLFFMVWALACNSVAADATASTTPETVVAILMFWVTTDQESMGPR